jgi:hypothetical protein
MTFETMALATVSRYASQSQRALVVAGFLLQVDRCLFSPKQLHTSLLALLDLAVSLDPTILKLYPLNVDFSPSRNPEP